MKKILLGLGFLFLILGSIGVVIPVLPTTPFVLLAAGCFAKSSDKWANWLRKSKIFGDYIENYEKKVGIPRKTKVISLTILWTGLSISILLVKKPMMTVLLLLIGIAVTIHILSIKTRERVHEQES